MFDFLDVTEVTLDTTPMDTSKWQRMFFDLEGSLDTKGDILQVAAITTDWDFNITDVFNMYFKNHKEIGSKEFNVHGISEEFLEKYAKGHFTEMLEYTPFYPKKPTMFISYTTFDVGRINAELKEYGKPLVDFGEEKPDLAYNLTDGKNCHFNAFRYGKKKGVQLSSEIGEEVFQGIFREISEFGEFHSRGNHDALYDSVMILALCRRFANERTNDADTER